ncbi:alpha/beta-hydrolase, partial [Hyaloscypha variabilis F]
YLSYPPDNKTDTTILYLTDIYGIPLVNNRLLGDSIAKAGYFVVMPDMFAGDAILVVTDASFNMTAWRAKHTTDVVDAIVNTTLNSMRTELGAKIIGGTGYCFGGKYIVRFLAAGQGLSAAFTAHPAGVVVEEWQAIAGPLSIGFGGRSELDGSNTPAQRSAAEAIFQGNNATYETTLYSGVEHGFAVRTDLTDKRKKFAQESAYFQAVRWFDAWIKN